MPVPYKVATKVYNLVVNRPRNAAEWATFRAYFDALETPNTVRRDDVEHAIANAVLSSVEDNPPSSRQWREIATSLERLAIYCEGYENGYADGYDAPEG